MHTHRTDRRPAVLFAALVAAAITAAVLIPGRLDNDRAYPPPDCAPTDCRTPETMYLTLMRLDLNGGEWVENPTYRNVPDHELIRRAEQLCPQLPSDPNHGTQLAARAQFALARDLDVRLVGAAAHLCDG